MKEKESSGPGRKRERHHRAQRSMTPAEMFRIFLIGKLRIENDYLAVLREIRLISRARRWQIARLFFANASRSE